MGFYVSGVAPDAPAGQELRGAHRAEVWLSLLHLLCTQGHDLLSPAAWERLRTNSGERVSAEVARTLADRLEIMLIAIAPVMPREIPEATRYLVVELIPFLRHSGGFEVT